MRTVARLRGLRREGDPDVVDSLVAEIEDRFGPMPGPAAACRRWPD